MNFDSFSYRSLPGLGRALAYATLLAAPLAAHASDGKIYPATACAAAKPADDATLERNYESLRNVGTATITVICPIIKDNANNTDGVDTARVGVYDASSTEPVECTLHSIDPGGNGAWSEYDYTGNSFQGEDELKLDGLDNSYVNGFYYLRCKLPRNSRIEWYRVTEP